nr:pre-mRNA-splicing factor 38B-like [Quercus suber]
MSGSNAESGSARSSQGSTWREQRQKRREDPVYEQLEERFGLGEGSYQTGRTASHASRHRQPDARDEVLERLWRLVRDLGLVARNERHRAGQDDRGRTPDAEEERRGMGSNQSGSRLYRERSHSRESRRRRDRSNSAESRRRRNRSRSREYGNRGSGSPEGRPRNAAMDAMSRALRRAARSPFSADIERAPMPDRFTRPKQ